MSRLVVVDPGVLATVQDLGRTRSAAYGVSPSGAVDWYSARAANRLVGNPDDDPLIETTLTGATFAADSGVVVAVTGAQSSLAIGGRPRSLWRSWQASGGERIAIGPAARGARSYLAVRGGFRSSLIMGSASTDVVAGFGGHVLAAGDALQIRDARIAPLRTSSETPHAGMRAYPRAAIPTFRTPLRLRATLGPDARTLGDEAIAALFAQTYRADHRSSRQALRLDGVPTAFDDAGERISAGVCAGGVQVTPSGLPTILLAEHQTTGGYPVALCVVYADIPLAAQVRPGDEVRFERSDLRGAHDALADASAALRSIHEIGEAEAGDAERLARGFYEGSSS